MNEAEAVRDARGAIYAALRAAGPSGHPARQALAADLALRLARHGHIAEVRFSVAPGTPLDAIKVRPSRRAGGVDYVQLYASPETVMFGDGDPLEKCRVTDIRNWTCEAWARKNGRLLAEDRCMRIEEVFCGVSQPTTAWRRDPLA